VASTIIGVTTVQQLYDNLSSFGTRLSAELLAEIDEIRRLHRDPAQ
jgi:aryl-alcohol dehydrogenase-like predicted oxidoreductase